MAIKAPELDSIKKTFPQFDTMEFVDIGGFKAVYKVTAGSSTEALKIIELPSNHALSDEENKAEQTILRARVNREVSVLGGVSLPELVRLGSIPLTTVTIDDRDYLVYSEEFIDGADLRKLIKANGPRPEEKELRILLLTLVKVIGALWTKGIIHRDIKPANIMKTYIPDRTFILMDLGIAYSVDEEGITSNTVNVPATIRYIAPEMLYRGFRNTIDWRSDLYSAALSVYEYAAFHHPLVRETDDLGTTVYNAMKKSPKFLRELRPDLNREFCTLIDQMLKKKQALRPSNIQMLIRNLEAGL
jgi:serine/threonine protein kinase